jgi:DNA-binding transcriptional MerR regulator
MAAMLLRRFVRAACFQFISEPTKSAKGFRRGFSNMLNRASVAIPEKLFFKIGEVCELTGVQAHVLRYWESEFPMLAPQKNRAGQRTYRKRDVEMALRIKELLYDDQYTIAGAKKRLAGELRGASKLKVVTPEMSAAHSAAQSAQTVYEPQETPPQVALPPPQPQTSYVESGTINDQPSTRTTTAVASNVELTSDQRDSVRHLTRQLRDLLAMLDAGADGRKSHRK